MLSQPTVFISAIGISFLLDLLLGDPAWMPHPVVAMGKAIDWAKGFLRPRFSPTPEGQRAAGRVLAFGLPIITLAFACIVLWVAGMIHPIVQFVIAVIWGWQALAMTGLRDESQRVQRALDTGTVEDGRAAVARIVGRDTAELDRAQVTRAAVETIAENFSDGVAAPLFYLVIGGAPLALCYKSINTMDSMVGYKNNEFIDFGRAAAKLDDVANFIPARIAALLLIAAAATKRRAKQARAMWKRDRRKHASPNSAQTESVMAGALGVALAGPAYYFGKLHDKPTIGDAERDIESADISRANHLMFVASIFGLGIFLLIRLACECVVRSLT